MLSALFIVRMCFLLRPACLLQVIKAGEKMRVSKKKSKMASNQGSCTRDWGKVRLTEFLVKHFLASVFLHRTISANAKLYQETLVLLGLRCM